MSLAEFFACIEGWKRANGAEEEPPAMDADRFDQIVAEIEKGNR
jgi:hypothetical protein